jgi:hypothetical protein
MNIGIGTIPELRVAGVVYKIGILRWVWLVKLYQKSGCLKLVHLRLDSANNWHATNIFCSRWMRQKPMHGTQYKSATLYVFIVVKKTYYLQYQSGENPTVRNFTWDISKGVFCSFCKYRLLARDWLSVSYWDAECCAPQRSSVLLMGFCYQNVQTQGSNGEQSVNLWSS